MRGCKRSLWSRPTSRMPFLEVRARRRTNRLELLVTRTGAGRAAPSRPGASRAPRASPSSQPDLLLFACRGDLGRNSGGNACCVGAGLMTDMPVLFLSRVWVCYVGGNNSAHVQVCSGGQENGEGS